MKLQSLRIPSGWTVAWHTMPDCELTKATIEEFSSSSLLLLYNTSANRIIDVCWQPENDINGHFVLKVLNRLEVFNPKTYDYDAEVDWEKPVTEFKTKDKTQLIEKLEDTLQTLKTYEDPRILIRRGVVNKEAEKLRVELIQNSLDEKLFQKIIKANQPKLEYLVIDHSCITSSMLEFLIENGHNLRIKNKAKQKLKANHSNSK